MDNPGFLKAHGSRYPTVSLNTLVSFDLSKIVSKPWNPAVRNIKTCEDPTRKKVRQAVFVVREMDGNYP